MVVKSIVGKMCLSKFLMDRGRGLNIHYDETIDIMGILRSKLHPAVAPFYEVVPKK